MKFKLTTFQKKIVDDVKDSYAPPVVPDVKKAIARQQQFMWMVNAAILDDKFDLDNIVNQYWSYAFVKPFPSEGGTLDGLYSSISRQLYENDAETYGVDLEEYPYESIFNIFKRNYGNWEACKNRHIPKINLTMEAEMARTTTPKKGTAKKPVKNKGKGTTAGKDTKPTGDSGPKMTKKRKAEILCCELLLKRKLTDAEISEQINEELEYNMLPRRVAKRRNRLNAGEMSNFGFDAPSKPVEEIGGGDKPTSRGKGKTKKEPEKPEKGAAKKPFAKKKMKFKLKKKK